MKNILILGELPITGQQIKKINSLGLSITYHAANNSLAEIDIALKKSQFVVFNNFDLNPYLKNCLHLKLIVLAATGFDWFDLRQADELGLFVCNLPEYSAIAVVEYMLWAALTSSKHYFDGISRVKNHNWIKLGLSGADITSKHAGIIGYGNVGKLLAKHLKTFDMKITVNTKQNEPISEGQWAQLDSLLSTCNFLFVCCTSNLDNKHLLKFDNLRQLQKNSIIISITPNEIFDLDDLAKLLSDRPDIKAILDLDPIPDTHPLLQCGNAIITPHIAFMTEETIIRRTDRCIQFLEYYLNNQPDKIPYITKSIQ